MRINAVLLVLLLCACGAPSDNREESADVQQLVEQIVARHPKLVRLTIHAVPTSETESKIIASNISKKIGNLSGPDADFDGDNAVNFSDLVIFKALFNKPPGPSTLAP